MFVGLRVISVVRDAPNNQPSRLRSWTFVTERRKCIGFCVHCEDLFDVLRKVFLSVDDDGIA
jgi:hypothetical protein